MYSINNIGRLHIELSSRCNASCPACSRNLAGGPVAPNLEITELTIDDIKNFFPKKFAENIIGINFCGNVGDPGMALDLLPILEYFQTSAKKYIAQQVRTNGGMRNPEYWKDVGKFFAGLPRKNDVHAFSQPAIVFSVDGLEDTNHIYRRGVKWDRLFANMQAYASTGAFGVWEFLVFEHNQHQVEEARSMAEKLGFHFAVKNPMGFGEYQGKQQGMNVYKRDGTYDYSIYPANFTGERSNIPEGYKINFDAMKNVEPPEPELTDFSRHLAKTSGITCKSLNQHVQELYVSASGHLLPCCFLGGVFGQFTGSYSRWQFNKMIQKMGKDKLDLRQNSIYEILMGPHFGPLFLNGWESKTVEEGRLLYCVEMCGSISAIDRLYQSKTINNRLAIHKEE
jgi:MoaA/NifB/PqqE/SkfB family radical SAM enzyme